MLMGCLFPWPPIICWTFVTSLVCWEFSSAWQHCCMCLANAAQKSWNQCASISAGTPPWANHWSENSPIPRKYPEKQMRKNKCPQNLSIKFNKIHKNVSILFASAVWPIFVPCVKTIVDGQAPGRPMGTASWTKNSWNCVGQHPSIFVSFILCKYTCLYFMWFHNVSYACSGRLRLIIAWNIIFLLGSKNHLLGPGSVSMWFWVVFLPKSNRGLLHRPAWVGQGGWAKLGWQPFSNQKSV